MSIVAQTKRTQRRGVGTTGWQTRRRQTLSNSLELSCSRHAWREAWRRVRKTFDTKQESAHTAADAHKKVDVELFQRSCSAAQLRQLAGLAKCYRRAQRWHPVVTPMMEGRDMCAKKRRMTARRCQRPW